MKFIDIHAHCYAHVQMEFRPGQHLFPQEADMLEFYDLHGVEKGVLLPACNVENTLSVQSNEEVLEICARHPDRFVPFCNVDPRAFFNSPRSRLDDILRWYQDKGCKGVGEICANLNFRDPRVQNLFAAAEKIGFPLTFHVSPFQDYAYGLVDEAGLPGLEESLKRFPKLNFLAHSQAFWCEIGRYEGQEPRFGYPTGPADGGRVAELMRKYPNLKGDLSAGSGCNALSRDRAHAARFLTEFQDQLFFGLDICVPEAEREKPHELPKLLADMCTKGEIAETVFRKVARENAIDLLCL